MAAGGKIGGVLEVGNTDEDFVWHGNDGPPDQPRGHRTLHFFDPEHNLLEINAEI